MRSHSVTCHPAEVTFPPLPQPKLVLDLATPEGCKAELTCHTWKVRSGMEWMSFYYSVSCSDRLRSRMKSVTLLVQHRQQHCFSV